MKRLACLSVDLDEVHHYLALHGLAQPLPAEQGTVYRVALPRFEALAQALGIPLTFFAVGADAKHLENQARLRALVAGGHEVANHSLDHRYDLTRLSTSEMQRQVRGGAEAIAQATGLVPVGFRAPGYLMNDRLVQVLQGSDVAYDSSVFPCPSYYSAKAAVLASQRLTGRRSTSSIGSPSVLTAPTRPYRLGKPYYRQGQGLLELPIQVTPRLRLPVIGTSLTLGGPRIARWLTGQLLKLPLVNLELHGIDLLGAQDGLQALSRYQRDLTVPVARKLEVLQATVRQLQQAGFEFVRLEQAAARLSA
jgi:hypothetical protein